MISPAFAPAWKIISSILPKETVEQIHFVATTDPEEQRQALLNVGIENESIPAKYGGLLLDPPSVAPSYPPCG